MTAKPFHLSGKVVVRNGKGQRLILKRSRKSKGNPGKWEFPGGKTDPGERIDEALLREVREETGLTITLEGIVGSAQSPLSGKTIAYLFFDARLQSGTIRLSTEHEGFRWVTLDELLAIKDLSPQYKKFVETYCREHGYSRWKREPKPAGVSLRELATHVRAYRRALPRYERFAKTLRRVLEEGVRRISPLAFVQARPKNIGSFAEKILRKNKYTDPLTEITDLCGARVITQIKPEADAVCRFIREHFIIDEANSLDTVSRLGATQFGYRSVHYIVQFKPGVFPGVPKSVLSLQAEIQVRTILQHAWSDVGHDRLYKSGFKVPDFWERESARVAAMLENADDTFARIVTGLEEYNSHFGAHRTPDKRALDIAVLQTRLKHDATDADATHRLARAAMARGEWPEVVRLIEKFPVRRRTSDLLCCLGMALCHLHRRRGAHREFKRGRELLREAAQVDAINVEAHLQLAETSATDAERLKHFQKAFEIAPSDPAVLAGYVRHKIIVEQSVAFLPLLRPDIEAAIKKCELQVRAGVNIPWAFYRIAAFHLLLGPEHEREALAACAHGVRKTEAADIVESAITAAELFARAVPDRSDVKCILRFLIAARQARFPSRAAEKRLRRFATRKCRRLQAPVIIVAGGCDPTHRTEMAAYRPLLREALADFKGTIISGGTRQGISGLVGELGDKFRDRLTTVGYLPRPLPRDGSASLDQRYTELRWTDGTGRFTALEPAQNWIDLIASGIAPQDVRVLGINGGKIAALEYRMAWALGARVGIVRGSGREADILEEEIKANEFEGMLVLPPDAMSLRAFLHTGGTESSPLTGEEQDRLARLVHARYLEQNRYRSSDRTMREWDLLDDDLKDSNREQVAYLTQILTVAGYRLKRTRSAIATVQFEEDELETMARLEHGRWNVERLRQGWHYGKKRDHEKRLTPYLVPWEWLDPAVKKWDFNAVRDFPLLLAEIGMQIVRTNPQTVAPASKPTNA